MRSKELVRALNEIENALADTTITRVSPERTFALRSFTWLRKELVSDKDWAARGGDGRHP